MKILSPFVVMLLSMSVVSCQEIAGIALVDAYGRVVKAKIGKILDINKISDGYDFGLRIKLLENTKYSDSFANVTVEVSLGSGFIETTNKPIAVITPFIVKSTDSTGRYSLAEYLQTGGNQKSIKVKLYKGSELLDSLESTFYVLHPRKAIDDLVHRKRTSLLKSEGQTIHINDGYVVNLQKDFRTPSFDLSIISSFKGSVYPDDVIYYFEFADSGDIVKLASVDYAHNKIFRALDYFNFPGLKIVTIEAVKDEKVIFSEVIKFEITFGIVGKTRSVNTASTKQNGDGGGNLRSDALCKNEDDECVNDDGDSGYHMNEPNEYNGCTTKCVKTSSLQSYGRQGWECGPCAMVTVTVSDAMQPNL